MMVPMPMQMPMSVPYPFAMMQSHPQYSNYYTDAGSGGGNYDTGAGTEEYKEEEPEQASTIRHPAAAVVGVDPQSGYTSLNDADAHYQQQQQLHQQQQFESFLTQQQHNQQQQQLEQQQQFELLQTQQQQDMTGTEIQEQQQEQQDTEYEHEWDETTQQWK